jgi:hypothetical protein
MENQSLHLNDQAVSALKEGARWTYFLSILGFVGVGLMVVASIFMSTIFSSLPNASEGNFNNEMGFNPSGFGSLITVLYLIFAVIYFFPVYYLYKYSTGIKKAIHNKSSELIANAFVHLKSHHKFIGVSVLIVISLYTIIFVFAMFAMVLK